MKQPDLEQLLQLLQRKQRAKQQAMTDLQPGDTIHLSLTAQEEVRLKQLLCHSIGKARVLKLLMEMAKFSFLTKIEARRAELTALPEDYAINKVGSELYSVLDTLLDEDQYGNPAILLLICLEREDLFTIQPDPVTCIVEQEEYGFITAIHIVYHNLYDLLKSHLQFAFCLWHQEQRRDE